MTEQLILTPQMVKDLAFGISVCFLPFVAIGLGNLGNAALLGIAKNPSMEPKIRTMSFLFIAFCESMAIFAIVMGLLVKFS